MTNKLIQTILWEESRFSHRKRRIPMWVKGLLYGAAFITAAILVSSIIIGK
jgi:hypothetical protein